MKTNHPVDAGLSTLWKTAAAGLAAGWLALPAGAQQIGTSISADGAAPNNNAMLDVQSPSTGNGKGILIPRVTQAQRTTASTALAGGLLLDSGNLRGGAAHGLMVYQTNGTPGLYFNTSGSAVPSWMRAGTFWSDGSTPMSGPFNLNGNRITNLYSIDISRYDVQIGEDALSHSSSSGSVAVGRQAVARHGRGGVAIGCGANADYDGTALGYYADGHNTNIAIGFTASAGGGKDRIAIGRAITNQIDDSTLLRGTLYLDGGTGLLYRSTVGTGGWTAKAFTIDHPEDPDNKVLRHYAVEGPEVLNVYQGRAQLVDGEADIMLPDYYSALNRTGAEIYRLTPIGGSTLLYIKDEVSGNRFRVAGDRDVRFSWTVYVPRNDAACQADLANRPVEQWKSELRPGQAEEENAAVQTGFGRRAER